MRCSPERRILPAAVSAALVLVYFLVPAPEWIAERPGRYLLRVLLSPLFHANLLHLVVNCINVFTLWSGDVKRNISSLAASYLISLLTYGSAVTPPVGMSNVLCVAAGTRSPVFSKRWWGSPFTWIFIVSMAGTALFPNVSALSHFVSFAAGVLVGRLCQWISEVYHDYSSRK